MRRYVFAIAMAALGSLTTAVGQEAVIGIPSLVKAVESNGGGVVCAMTDANRVYLSRDGGENFIAIDTARLMTEPWIENRELFYGQSPLLHFDTKNDFVWIRSQKGGVLCRHSIRTGEWSAPIPFEDPYIPPTWLTSAIASGAERTVVVAIGGYTEELGEHNYILRSYDAGDTWHRLPDLDSTKQQTNPYTRSLAVMPDGTVLASTARTGINRLAAGDSVWQNVFATWGEYSLVLTGTSVYAWNRTQALYSDNYGVTFTPVNLGKFTSMTAASYRGDTVAIILTDTSSRSTRVVAVLNGDVVATLQNSIKHAHVAPFVGSIADSTAPKIVVSGNGITESLRRDENLPVRMRFVPETYICHRMCRITTGLAVYVRGHGLYRINRDGAATLDTSITYQLRRALYDLRSSNDDGLILNLTGLTQAYVVGARIDTIFEYPPIVRTSALIHDSVVYAGAGNQGVETFQLSDTARRRMMAEGMPTFGGMAESFSVSVQPMVFRDSRLTVLMSASRKNHPFTTSPEGGVFTIANDRWERVNDGALDAYRIPFLNGDCLDGVCTFTSYESSIDTGRIFSYSENTNTVEQLSGSSDATSFRLSTIVDNNHIAMTGLHDTLRVVELSTKSTRTAIVGVPLAVSTLNGKVAVSTLRDGILVYPLDALTSVSSAERRFTPRLQASYNEHTDEIRIVVDNHTSNDGVVFVSDILGHVVATVDISTHPTGSSFGINAGVLASGCYVVVLKHPRVGIRSATVHVRK